MFLSITAKIGKGRKDMISNLEDRAMRAYFRSGDSLDQPSESLSSVERVDGKDYVFLRNSFGLLAAYQIMGSGRLMHMESIAGASEVQ